MYRFAAVFLGLTVLANPALADQPKHDILVTLDQVMIARSVAAKCGSADTATSAAFLRHYRIIAEQAAVALKALSSDLNQAHIEKVLSDHFSEIDRRVTAIVAQESCEGPLIKETLRKYDSLANITDTQLLADTNR